MLDKDIFGTETEHSSHDEETVFALVGIWFVLSSWYSEVGTVANYFFADLNGVGPVRRRVVDFETTYVRTMVGQFLKNVELRTSSFEIGIARFIQSIKWQL